MSCCNQKRAALRSPEAYPSSTGAQLPDAPAEVLFAYTGARTLTVAGAVTGRLYQFNGPGALRAVDRRDAPGMMAVPMLEKAAP